MSANVVDALLAQLTKERGSVQGNGSQFFTPADAARICGVDLIEGQRLLLTLEQRGDLVVVAQGDMWCLPEDEHRF